jgi:hypothetical protein
MKKIISWLKSPSNTNKIMNNVLGRDKGINYQKLIPDIIGKKKHSPFISLDVDSDIYKVNNNIKNNKNEEEEQEEDTSGSKYWPNLSDDPLLLKETTLSNGIKIVTNSTPSSAISFGVNKLFIYYI